MCAIAGYATADPTATVDRPMLGRMAASLAHRGPDGEGFHTGPGIGLAFRRLAIVDLATGDQPIASEDGRVVVVCNGEIYNHRALRDELVGRGHRFATASDAEVVVHLYEERGEDFVHALRGMFAIALWDARARRLLLARDRLGIKPLVYARTAGGLAFASESKAILAAGLVEPRADAEAVRRIISYGHALAPRTLFEGVSRLPPAHVAVWSGGDLRLSRYWRVGFPARDGYDRSRRAEDWAAELRAKLDECVRLHLAADVPVGAFLSAGLDSSSIAALMARAHGAGVPTWSLAFERPEADETRHQRLLDEFDGYGLDGHRIVCRDADFGGFARLIWHLEEIVLAGTSLALMRLSQAASSTVKVVLSGEGADEIFGGYRWYAKHRLLSPLFALPRPVRSLLAALPGVRRRWPGAAGLIRGPRAIGFERYARGVSPGVDAGWADRLLAPDLRLALGRAGPAGDEPRPPEDFARWHPFARMQYFDLTVRMPGAILHGLDRVSMAYGIEARVPFVDHELVELAARIPPQVKMRGLTEKHVLRRAIAADLPDEIARRRKRGLQVPMAGWLRSRLPEAVRDALDLPALRDAGLFDPAAVRATLDAHRSGVDCSGVLGSVLGVQLWHALYVRGRVDLAGVSAPA
ncbi:MAG: asparagine synthase (glutamine-hydrolyzing) [Burkholderiales bacterium]